MRVLKYSVYACIGLLLWLACLPWPVLGGGVADPDAGGRPDPRDEPIQPLPSLPELDSGKVALGRRLFSDPRLSRDGSVSCASCHDLSSGGDDGRPRPVGVGGTEGEVNTLTVFNAAYNVAFFWDGRAATLEQQIASPITGEAEMGARWPEVIDRLKSDPVYSNAFDMLYGSVRRDSVIDALAVFVRSLVTPDSRFDRYLRGDESAISAREKEGYRLFKKMGCAGCHQGRNVGGNLFQVIGVMEDYGGHGEGSGEDNGEKAGVHLGRYNVTGREEDRYKYRVPSLRNVARTAPYFHDGRAETLEEAVEEMARYQIGQPLEDDDKTLIVEFLETLTGKYRGEPL